VVPFLVVGELPGERWLSRIDDNALLFAATGSALLAADIALPIPSSLVGTALGARLGFWAGSTSCWLGLMAGNLIGYLVGHLYPQRLVTKLPDAPLDVIVFLSRPIPIIAEAAALAAGANRMSAMSFLTACALGNGIYSIALCANASLWLAGDWKGPALVFPMLLPVIAWLAWRRLSPQFSMHN
jgi:uncharacterized membrane protein YdjX (TVP38/TMEM64 family)